MYHGVVKELENVQGSNVEAAGSALVTLFLLSEVGVGGVGEMSYRTSSKALAMALESNALVEQVRLL